MSVDTLTTCATVQRKCRSRGKVKRSNVKKDLTCRTELADVKTPEVHIQEDLGFNLLDVCDIPQDMLFPGEFNVYLQDKLKSLCDENRQLSLLVKSREEEVVELKDQLLKKELLPLDASLQHSLSHNLDSIRHADMAACRVMELSRQVCELTAQLEEQKGRCLLAENNLLSLMESQENPPTVPSEILARKEAEIKSVSDKLHSTNSKLFECRNKLQHLQQELKNAHKVLICEVGEGVSIPDLLLSGGTAGSWRGRAQQIQVLQQRVMELSERLRKYCDYRISDNNPSSCGEGRCSTKERKASLENALQEASHFKQQLNEYIRKFDAAKARIRVLESENSSFKAHIQTLTDKGARNDDFIQILQGQITQLEGRFQTCKEEARSELKKSDRFFEQLQDDLKIEKQRSVQLLSNLEDKEKQLKRLEDILFDLKEREISASKMKEETIQTVELPAINLCSVSEEKQNIENQKVQVSEQEHKKLLELIGSLNRRLNDARHDSDKHKSALRLERQRVARLEAKLARQEQEKMSIPRRQVSPKKVTASPAEDGTSKEEMEDRLEILQEEVLTLKTRISCLEQEKEDDLRAFSSILNGASPQTLSKRRTGSYTLPTNEPAKPKS
ncbi:coiled-coil domain-containing protein 13-like [Thrips palmi]|uniref:Coiled-coil domain-containing protein 13-like n=1 Tax=Thrips palmi TaxID=161013 RepID=A0A6P8ZNB0_THRPL|nr:coiled-coil domain-containing protein 13-like [Thrips palmi]